MDCSSGIPKVPTLVVGGGAAATQVSCRWNPTKEQINTLESLYLQGLKTPTAEQIQEITGRLQAYGHLECKNVFYWFQNHKARQRLKEKQDRLSLFRQYNHHHCRRPTSFTHLSTPSNVYKPCYAHPQVVTPSTTTRPIKRRSPSRSNRPRSTAVGGFMLMHLQENDVAVGAGSNKQDDAGENYSHQETLDLFPLHPTGILQERVGTRTTGNGSCLASRACTSSYSGYFDFFC